ncbi:hypothetical protein BD309DRAFT_957561 [Dichomitus squalens]|nr:hypothetical protein BD309DRAFT_957561 [Dichomitus squalens]
MPDSILHDSGRAVWQARIGHLLDFVRFKVVPSGMNAPMFRLQARIRSRRSSLELVHRIASILLAAAAFLATVLYRFTSALITINAIRCKFSSRGALSRPTRSRHQAEDMIRNAPSPTHLYA